MAHLVGGGHGAEAAEGAGRHGGPRLDGEALKVVPAVRGDGHTAVGHLIPLNAHSQMVRGDHLTDTEGTHAGEHNQKLFKGIQPIILILKTRIVHILKTLFKLLRIETHSAQPMMSPNIVRQMYKYAKGVIDGFAAVAIA
jgi:hypothetical protein